MPIKDDAARNKYFREYMQKRRAAERMGKDAEPRSTNLGQGRAAPRSEPHTDTGMEGELRMENDRLREQLAAAVKAVAHEKGRREAEPLITPDMLSMTAQQKLEIAKRGMERKLGAEHAARMQKLDEEVRQRVLKEGKEYLDTLKEMRHKVEVDEKYYRTLINDHKPPFTVDQYKTILMCLHPDGERTLAKLHAAFVLLESKKEMLTGERKKKRIV